MKSPDFLTDSTLPSAFKTSSAPPQSKRMPSSLIERRPAHETVHFPNFLPLPLARLHLSWVVDKLQSRIAGDHGAQVGDRACCVKPVLRPIHFDIIKELDH